MAVMSFTSDSAVASHIHQEDILLLTDRPMYISISKYVVVPLLVRLMYLQYNDQLYAAHMFILNTAVVF